MPSVFRMIPTFYVLSRLICNTVILSMTIGSHVTSRKNEAHDTAINSKMVRQHWQDISSY